MPIELKRLDQQSSSGQTGGFEQITSTPTSLVFSKDLKVTGEIKNVDFISATGSSKINTLNFTSSGILINNDDFNATSYIPKYDLIYNGPRNILSGDGINYSTYQPESVTALNISQESIYNAILYTDASGNIFSFGEQPSGSSNYKGFTQLTFGTNYTVISRRLLLNSAGNLFAWGLFENNYGQYGNGTTIGNNTNTPIQIGSTIWSNLAMASSSSFGIRASDGILFSWGWNYYGQLGTGDTTQYHVPQQIGSTSWSKIFANRLNNSNTFAIRASDGILFGWGDNSYGQIGDGTTTNRTSPVQVGSTSWSFILQYSYATYTYGIRASDGILFGWGNNSNRQLFDGTTTNSSTPKQIGSTSWDGFYTLQNFVGVRRASDQKIFIIGSLNPPDDYNYNSTRDNIYKLMSSDLLNQTTFPLNGPTLISNTIWSQIGANCAIRQTDSKLFIIGGSGLNYSSTTITSNVITNNYKKLESRTSDGKFAFLINDSGELYSWGDDAWGGLGNSTSKIGTNSPQKIGNTIWKDISTDGSSALALREDGVIFGWGKYVSGSSYPTVSNEVPVQIGSTIWIDIGCNLNTRIAQRKDGTLWGWGANNSGQLGLGVNDFKNDPTQLGTTLWKSFSKLSDGYTLFLRNDGILFSAGINYTGQLGTGNTNNVNTLTQIGSTIWRSVHSGGTSSFAIRASDGVLFAWGGNSNGQLGDGTYDSKHIPTQIGNTIWYKITCHVYGTLAIREYDRRLYGWGISNFSVFNNNLTANPQPLGTTVWKDIISNSTGTFGLRMI